MNDLSAPTLMVLSGDAQARARVQAEACDAGSVRRGILSRLEEARPRLASTAARAFLRAQQAFCESECAAELAELHAMAEAFDVPQSGLFGLFHLSALSHAHSHEGCSAFGVRRGAGGAILAKNRDLSGAHPHFQQVFLQRDPGFRAGHVLHVGSLGMPGVYSSGVNAKGFALADTAIPAPLHAVGWPRYLLMTRLLQTCATTQEAVDFIGSARHSGGGSLILADAKGETAAVELFADGARIARTSPAFRTNHFWTECEAQTRTRQSPAAVASTLGRRATLAVAMADPPQSVSAAVALLAHDGSDGREALRRRGEGEDAITVSTAAYDTMQRSLLFIAWHGERDFRLQVNMDDHA